jgi:diketogulonate reductase-like aldo/keto reductase
VPAIPKSTSEQRTRDNANVFDFYLDEHDMHTLDLLHDERRKVVRWDDLQVGRERIIDNLNILN